MTPYQARLLVDQFEELDGFRELLSGILDIVTALFGGKKKAKPAPRTREDALVEKFGGIQLE